MGKIIGVAVVGIPKVTRVDKLDKEFISRFTEPAVITVYHKSKQLKGKYVAALFVDTKMTGYIVVEDTIESLHNAIKDSGLYRIPPQPDDDPAIKEIWVSKEVLEHVAPGVHVVH